MSMEAISTDAPVWMTHDTLGREILEYGWYLAQERTRLYNPEPRHHVRAFTYQPKIRAVIDRECGQTIRPLREYVPIHKRIKVGDIIMFHGWQDKPYRSKWSPWTLSAVVSDVEELRIDRPYGFTIVRHDPPARFVGSWDGPLGHLLARLDGIDPPTGRDLYKVLTSFSGSIQGMTFQIIRWDLDTAVLENTIEETRDDDEEVTI